MVCSVYSQVGMHLIYVLSFLIVIIINTALSELRLEEAFRHLSMVVHAFNLWPKLCVYNRKGLSLGYVAIFISKVYLSYNLKYLW